MKKVFRKKSTLIAISVLIVLIALSAWFGTFALRGAAENVLTSSHADEVVGYDDYPLDILSWERETYRNAPDFEEAVISLNTIDHSCIKYVLPTTQEEQYSMEASLCSPRLNVASNYYTLRFSYFTRMRAGTPHKITLLAGDNGVDFVEIDSIVCFDTEEKFVTGELTVNGAYPYLKLHLYTFYSYDSPSDVIDRGIYFEADSFVLRAEKEEALDQSYFGIGLTEGAESVSYNGREQLPDVVVYSNKYEENTDYTYVVNYYSEYHEGGTNVPCRPVHAGVYTVEIDVRNRSNSSSFVVTKTFEIKKETLTVRGIDYIYSNSRINVLYVDAVDSKGRTIDLAEEDVDLTYKYYFDDGTKQEGSFSINQSQKESASVYALGIVFDRSGDFALPTEESLFEVKNNLGEEPYYDIKKHTTLTYDGLARYYPTENVDDSVFFTEPGSASAPSGSIQPAVTYYYIQDDMESAVNNIRDAGSYRCVLSYGWPDLSEAGGADGEKKEYVFYVTVLPRPVVTYIYTGKNLIKSYDGTDVLFDGETETVLTELSAESLVCIDDPEYPGGDGILRTEQISDNVVLQYSKATYARSIGKTYIALQDPALTGADAFNYYLDDSFHVMSAVLLTEDTYEKREDAYRVAEDVYYRLGKEYVTGTFRQEPVTVGDPVSDLYYQYENGWYTPTEDATFIADKAYYKFLSVNPVENNVVAIDPSYLVLKSDKDASGMTITCPDKVYSPGDYSAPNVDSDITIPCYGNNAEPITYEKISFILSDCNVGRHELSLRLSDETLLDRYLRDVMTPAKLYGNVVPLPLQVDVGSSAFSNVDKEYDGDETAYLTFDDLNLLEAPAGFPAFSEYTLSYRSAVYSQTDVGTGLTITVSGIELTGLTASKQAYLSNYSIQDVQITGNITRKRLVVLTESIRVFERQVPRINSDAGANADTELRRRVYLTEEAAHAGGPLVVSSPSQGSYFMRVDLSDPDASNFYIEGGYVIIPMEVTASEKARQKIVLPDLDLSSGNTFTILSGSVLTLNVLSVNEESRLNTGLNVACRLNVLPDPEGCLIVIGSDTWRTSKTGRFTMTLTQAGNDYYYEADPVVLNFIINSNESSLSIAGTSSIEGLYDGDRLPDLTSGQYTAIFNGNGITGTLTASDDVYLEAGQKGYAYTLTADSVVDSYRADFSIASGTSYYVKSGNEYEKYSGEYNRYDTYYTPRYDRAGDVVVGDIVPGATYYENVYAQTTDSVFSAEKTYYTAYYEKENYFFTTADSVFLNGKEYYTVSYEEAYVAVGTEIDGDYYEQVAPNDYVITSDVRFDGEKTYYVAKYALASVISGRTIPSSTVYYERFQMPSGIYFEKSKGYYYHTVDTVFEAGKTYYTVSYNEATVPIGKRVDDYSGDIVYYEKVSDNYVITADRVFDGDTVYYTALYTQAVVYEGNTIPLGENYYERTKDEYTLTEDVEFRINKTYYRVLYAVADQSIAEPGRSISGGAFYEIDRSVFHLTYDNVFLAGKEYYYLGYVPAYFVSAGDLVDVELYREKTDDVTYAITEGDTFTAGKRYILSTWTPADDLLSGDDLYEKAPDRYALTEDETFLEGKTYYILQYSSLSVTVGDPVGEGVYEYGFSSVLSDDGVFLYRNEGGFSAVTEGTYQAGKTYYTASYVIAVSPVGQRINGKEYYEKLPDEYYLTDDDPLDEGKTYYLRQYVEVMFLENGNLPQGEFFRAVARYEQTSDNIFNRSKIYYSVSYTEVDVEIGRHVVGNYYEKKGNNYYLSSDVYFSDKAYYRASFVAMDTLSSRLIDDYSAYYMPATGTYAADRNYYRFDGKKFRYVEDAEVGTPVGEETYVLFEGPEFVQNERYYYLSYLFVGEAPVEVTLTSEKTTVTVYTVSSSSSLYGEEPALIDFVEKVTVNNGTEQIVPIERWAEFGLTFALKKATVTEGENEPVVDITDFSFSSQPTGVYTFENNRRENYEQDAVFLELTTRDNDSHRFVLAAGTTIHTVNKNKITVCIPEQEKFYGESVPSVGTLLSKMTFEGATREIADSLRQNYSLSVQAYSYSQRGEYPIYVSVKQQLLAGDAIPANTYYEREEGEYSLTEDTVFSGEKTYYVALYTEASVTAGDEVSGKYYERLSNSVYAETEDTVFVEEKIYYTCRYEAVDVYSGMTIEELEQNYDIVVVYGFLIVKPISIRIEATSVGHDYGDVVAEITKQITVLSDARLTAEEKEKLKEEVVGDVTTFCEGLSSTSDSGEYLITITYNGSNENVIVTTRRDCYYSVHSATLKPESFHFQDTSYLYDGMLHSLTVSYNTTIWPDVTITYDKGSFSEIGNYRYTAVVSLKNYEDLVLQATMSICTLSVLSSNQIENAVTVTITDPTCSNGVNGNYSVVLRPVTNEDKIAELTEIIDEAEVNTHTIKGVYTILTTLNSSETTFGYSSYDVTVIPAGLTYKDNLVLFGYSYGKFQKIEYTYNNGAYTFTVSSGTDSSLDPLSYFAFVEVTEVKDEGIQYKWVFVAIIGVVALLIIGIILTALSSSGKKRGKSRRRHNRWA